MPKPPRHAQPPPPPTDDDDDAFWAAAADAASRAEAAAGATAPVAFDDASVTRELQRSEPRGPPLTGEERRQRAADAADGGAMPKCKKPTETPKHGRDKKKRAARKPPKPCAKAGTIRFLADGEPGPGKPPVRKKTVAKRVAAPSSKAKKPAAAQVVPGLDSDSDDDPDEAPFDDENWVDPLPPGTRKKRAFDKIAPYRADFWEHLDAAIEKKTQKPRKKKKPDLVKGQTFLNFAPAQKC